MGHFKVNKHEFVFWIFIIMGLLIVHFHNPEIFSRKLIFYDDINLIQPLKEVDSINEYLENYLFDKNKDSFPLRDLTFFFDFKLSSLGIQTFWITNFLFFIAFLFLIILILRLAFPERRQMYLRCFLFAVVAFHPVNIEIIQWATSRKHVMVLFFIAWGTYKVLNLYYSGKTPKIKDWIGIFILYLLSILCWPTAILWIFWVIFLFRRALLKNPLKIIGIAAALLIILFLQLNILNFSDIDFANRINEPRGEFNLEKTAYFGFMALGRYAFNTVLPIRLAAYYNVRSAFNYLGYLFMFLFLLLFFYASKKIWKIDEKKEAVYFIFLAILLFMPSFFLTIKNADFVMADRYVPIALPYLLIGFALVFNRYLQQKSLGYKHICLICFIAFILLFAYFIISFSLVKYWKDDYTLMVRCADVEHSAMCLEKSIEKAFDKGGCSLASPFLRKAQKLYGTYNKKYEQNSLVDFVTYHGLCIYFSTLNPKQKMEELKKLYGIYNEHSPILLSEILALLEIGEPQKAHDLAEESYLSCAYSPEDTNIRLINLFRGQADFLCVIAQNQEQCEKKVNLFKLRFSLVRVNEKQISWGFAQTMDAYNKGVGKKSVE